MSSGRLRTVLVACVSALALSPLGGAAGPTGMGGPATRYVFNQPSDGSNALSGIAIDGNGDLLIGSTSVLRVDHAGRIGVFARLGSEALAVDPAGNVYINTGIDLRKVAPGGAMSTIDSVNGVSVDGTVRAVDGAGDFYITAGQSGEVYELTPKGVSTTLYRGSDNGESLIALDKAGDLFISEIGEGRILERTVAGKLRTVVNGLRSPAGIVVEPSGAIDVAQPYSYVVRRVSPSGRVTTIAGNGLQGFSGDGGPATKASLDTPTALALDAHGNLYIEDEGSSFDSPVVRKVSPSGRITTVAGSTCRRVKATRTNKPHGVVVLHGSCGQNVLLTLKSAATLHWTCAGCPTGITLENGVLIGDTFARSTAHSGSSYVEAGRQKIQVSAGGAWSLTLTPAPAPKPVSKLVLRGRGETKLAPIMLAAPTRLTWSCPHCSNFQIVGLDSTSLLFGQAKSGSINLPKRTYIRQEVDADAAWTIRIGGTPVAPPPLPTPIFTVGGGSLGPVVAAGSRLALTVSGGDAVCRVYVASMRKATAVPTKGVPDDSGGDACSSGDANVAGLWLGTAEIAAMVDDSPSPHGEDWTLWSAPPSGGSFHQVGDTWSWTDSDVPPQDGCAKAVTSGGGVVAIAQIPNDTGVVNGVASKPICATATQTVISLSGTATKQVTVSGVWEPLATDGKQILLEAIGATGEPNGQVELVGLDGKAASAQPKLDPGAVKGAYQAWLTDDGIVLLDGSKVVAPKWTVGGVSSATIAEGRLIYVKGSELRARRLKDGVDRRLMPLPKGQTFAVAAGAFGVGLVGAPDSGKIGVYKLPWSVVDETLPA